MKLANIVKLKSKKHHPRRPHSTRRCNLCKLRFSTQTKFDRICHRCKQTNPLYRFSEWLPEHEQAVFHLNSRLIA